MIYIFRLMNNFHQIRSTRNNVDLVRLQFRTTSFKCSNLCIDPKLFIVLSLDIKNSVKPSNYQSYKKEMKDHSLKIS